MKRLLWLGVLCLAACTSSWQREKTADASGCRASDIRNITADSGSFDTLQAWYADCRGQRYRCVFVAGEKGGCYPVAADAH